MRPRVVGDCFLYVADRGPARLALSRRGYAAITFGHVIVAARAPNASLLAHERRHVAQYRRIGCAFIPVYVLWYARRGYAAHPLERDASRDPRLFA
ncbi:MAG: hypothetical protein M3O91_03520 [Chloroflexota bacterium]|nr:hypothetical protein [Chloroflexota bacterium]